MNSSKPAAHPAPPAKPHTWTQPPNMIYADFGQMETAELRCTLVLIRETYGYHRQATKLTYDDFLRLTTIKSKATIGAGLKAVARRGYFKRGGQRSQWLINSENEPGAAWPGWKRLKLIT